MKRSTIITAICVLALVSLFTFSAAFAADDAHTDIDPNANACFEGGSLYGQCDTEAMWKAGWFRAQVELGALSADDVPAEFAWAVPGHDSSGGGSSDDHGKGDEEICIE